jgi:glycosyltransferase involved in cell wall biosynthesis
MAVSDDYIKRENRKIAIVGEPWDNAAPDVGTAASIVACELARSLARDWQVTIYGQRQPGQKRSEIGLETVEFKRLVVFRKHQRLLEIVLGILGCWTRRNLGNYIFSYFYHFFYFLRVALSLRASKTDVVLVVNLIQGAAIIKFFNPSATVCMRMACEWLTQFATAATERRLRAVDLIFGNSEYTTDKIRARFPEIATRCHTLRHGVDTVRFGPLPGAQPQNEGPQRLLFLARVSPEKGAHVLIQAFKILAENRPDLHLDIVGAVGEILPYMYLAPDLDDRAIGDLRQFYGKRLSDMIRRQLIFRKRSYIDDLTAQAAGDERIVFHGAVSQSETIGFFRRAAMLVYPSVWNEPAGRATIEAAACGLPIISTYSGGIPEFVEDGRTGLLTARGDAWELAQAISRVLDDPALARAMGEAGRQLVLEQFTWEASARRFAELIESLSPADRGHGDTLKNTASQRLRPLGAYSATGSGRAPPIPPNGCRMSPALPST